MTPPPPFNRARIEFDILPNHTRACSCLNCEELLRLLSAYDAALSLLTPKVYLGPSGWWLNGPDGQKCFATREDAEAAALAYAEGAVSQRMVEIRTDSEETTPCPD